MSFPSSSPAANTFLVDSLISACRSDSFYSNSASMYMPPSTDIGTYGMQTCGLLPSLAKREVNHQNMGMNVHPYIPQVDSWTDPNRSCRIEQPVTQQVPTCSFTANIKEESNCCMYSDKRTKLISSDVPSYQRLVSESCPIENPEVPVPGYFRLSQTYATGKTQEYNNSPETSSTVMLQLNPRGSSKPQISSQLQMEKKMNENPNNQDNSAKVVQVESPEPKSTLQEERSCLAEGSVSSPEVQEKESKGIQIHPSSVCLREQKCAEEYGGHESEEVYGSRFVQAGHSAPSRPSGVAESSDFSSCSFAPKSTVFSTSWSTVHPQPPAAMTGLYHPYMHQPPLGAGETGRYVRSQQQQLLQRAPLRDKA
uniref:Homeobox D10 n=1 Tax=Pelodiscus sinensis TaxID=13735 RepID=K7F5A8_PELSI